ncbi:MAG: acetone carboxylase [Micrococcales bacterium]
MPNCSRKDCTNPATVQLVWNNPKIHTPDREKIWLACPEHEQYLIDYLQNRQLLKTTKPL